jgi:hypothetical protein
MRQEMVLTSRPPTNGPTMVVARLRHEPDGGEVGDQQDGEVDQERHAPGDGVHQQAADERAEDGRRG